MGRIVFVNEVVVVSKEPYVCPSCEKSDTLQRGMVFENVSNGKTFLCGNCSAVVVVTTQNLRRVELEASDEVSLMLKDNYVLRRVE